MMKQEKISKIELSSDFPTKLEMLRKTQDLMQKWLLKQL